MARALQARTRRARGSQFGAAEVIKRALEVPGNYLRVRMRAWTVISARGQGKHNSAALLLETPLSVKCSYSHLTSISVF